MEKTLEIEMRGRRARQVLKGEIMEGQCRHPPHPPRSSGMVVVVDAAAAVWVLLPSQQLQTKIGFKQNVA